MRLPPTNANAAATWPNDIKRHHFRGELRLQFACNARSVQGLHLHIQLTLCLPPSLFPSPSQSTLLQLGFHLHFCLCLRSSNYVVICAIFGNASDDDDDEANDKLEALSSSRRCTLHAPCCTLHIAGWQFLSVELSVRSMSIGLLMAANASA